MHLSVEEEVREPHRKRRSKVSGGESESKPAEEDMMMVKTTKKKQWKLGSGTEEHEKKRHTHTLY